MIFTYHKQFESEGFLINEYVKGFTIFNAITYYLVMTSFFFVKFKTPAFKIIGLVILVIWGVAYYLLVTYK